MSAEPQMIDPALDRALATSREPAMPSDLAARVTAQAVKQPQRSINGPFPAWRTRRSNRTRRTRRPVLFGIVGGGLMAASAVAAAWVTDGSFEIARITKPVVELFMPEAPEQTASAPAAPVAARPAAVETPEVAETPTRADRGLWIDRPFVRAAFVRQRIERIRARRALAGDVPVINRPLERRVLRQARLQSGNGLTEAQRTRIRERIQAMPPEQRQQRIEEFRQRRAASVPPAVRERVIENRRARIADRMRERAADTRPATFDAPVPTAPNSPSAAGPQIPTASDRPSADAVANRRSMIVQDSGPGGEPMQLPEARPNMPAADTAATAAARRAAIQARIRAARAAQRARAAGRNPPQRPQRPRIPRPRR